MGVITGYIAKYNELVTEPWQAMACNICMMVLVVACPYLGAIGGSIFRAVKTFGNCFSKVQKAAMTREFNKTKKTITTPGYLRPKKKPRKQPLRLADDADNRCMCIYKSGEKQGLRCEAAKKNGTDYCGRHKNCGEEYRVRDDESKNPN